MNAKIEYRKLLLKSICKNCEYQDICDYTEQYDCEAFKKLVKICEDLDLCNPDN